MTSAARKGQHSGNPQEPIRMTPAAAKRPVQHCPHGFHWATQCEWCWYERRTLNWAPVKP